MYVAFYVGSTYVRTYIQYHRNMVHILHTAQRASSVLHDYDFMMIQLTADLPSDIMIHIASFLPKDGDDEDLRYGRI